MNTDEREEEYLNRIKKSHQMLKILEIPTDSNGMVCWKPAKISSIDLYDILMDEERLKVLVSKLRNKAFW
jgi:hypothetical protein